MQNFYGILISKLGEKEVKLMRKIFTVLLVVFIVLSFTTMTLAAEKRAATKLERGVKNVAFGWTEIPKTIVDTSKKDGAVVGVTIGTLKGICQAVARTLSGTVDVATFPAGTYDKPALKPSMIPGATAAKPAAATK